MKQDQKPSASGEPVISYSERPAGRETLAAIAEAHHAPSPHRAPSATQHYGDRISNAPGALSPKTARALDAAPEITVTFREAGRETQALLHEPAEAAPPEIEIEGDAAPLASELITAPIASVKQFLVRAPLATLKSSAARTWLVQNRLLPHLPVDDPGDITTIEVEATADPSVVRLNVWCRVK